MKYFRRLDNGELEGIPWSDEDSDDDETRAMADLFAKATSLYLKLHSEDPRSKLITRALEKGYSDSEWVRRADHIGV